MADFVLVTCRKEEQKASGFLSVLKSLMSGILSKRENEFQTRSISFQDRLTLAVVQLPYTSTQLSRMGSAKIGTIATKAMSLGNSALFYLPDTTVCENNEIKGGMMPRSVNLFKACIPGLLDELCTKRGKKLRDLELAVMQGPDPGEMFEMIRYVAPYFKYITAVVRDRSAAEIEADAVYDEYGLPVGISTDSRLSLKGADIVISMAEAAFFDKQLRPGAGTLVIDLFGEGISLKADGGVVVKGLTTAFPENIMLQLGNEVLSAYDRNSLSELSLMLMEGFQPGVRLTGHNELSRLYSCFRKSGFVLASVTGRYNTYRLGDLELPAGKLRVTDN